MDRRQFLNVSALSLAGLALPSCLEAKKIIKPSINTPKGDAYSVVILGDTHYDTLPSSVYHSNSTDTNPVHLAEFDRNGKMWIERCPRLLKRAACLVEDDTKLILQVGDLIQGDCDDVLVHKKMLADAMDLLKASFGELPLVTVVGNHDIRGLNAESAYKEYMPQRMSAELGKQISKTTFSFNIGNDAYLVLDFNKPDDSEIERLLSDSRDARNTFVITHGPLFPYDDTDGRWYFHGGPGEDAKRRHFRSEFAARNAICLCGHVHTTEFADYRCDEGSIMQMTMSSVWESPDQGTFSVEAQTPEDYGKYRLTKDPNMGYDALYEEYRSGFRRYFRSRSVGSYKMTVDGNAVTIDFYAGDSPLRSKRFYLR